MLLGFINPAPRFSLITSSTRSIKSFLPHKLVQFFKQCTRSHSHHPSLLVEEEHIISLLHKHPTRNRYIQIHSQLITSGFHRRRPLDETQLIIWNTLIRVYSQAPFPEEAINLYKLIFHEITPSSVSYDSFTFSFLFKACANVQNPIIGSQIHAHIVKFGFEIHVYVQTALVNMYLMCECLNEGIKVFDEMPVRNHVTWNVVITGLTRMGDINLARHIFDDMPGKTIVSWTGIIDGYVRLNRHTEALSLFRQMTLVEGIMPTEITVLTFLTSVWKTGSFDLLQSLHAYSVRTGFISSDIRVTNSFIDTYVKCGSIDYGFELFQEVPRKQKNLITWTTIISGLAMHGKAKEAVNHFQEMENEGLKPNRVTFLSVLNACSHGGLIEQGREFFEKMVNVYQIIPDIKHYGCMIDMFGRVGMLEEAEKMAMEIPTDIINVIIWRTLLGACSYHGNAEMSERAMKKIFELERDYSGDYVLLSNTFSGAGRFDDAETIRNIMDGRNVLKVPGLSLSFTN
ncbi:hypothetical protein MKW94_001160 [Papaver nudicaule]|uniref:Pentatricopeptide repeat-containing protein n=1 Tax=Papaver nudicaule TaxID=74823 RepID=A0AA41VV66_PAPNU|nr:hypothetical protein [Papaver nudicaule]MCL7048033.1 hypothetical protein [Papaver nudicaule]